MNRVFVITDGAARPICLTPTVVECWWRSPKHVRGVRCAAVMIPRRWIVECEVFVITCVGLLVAQLITVASAVIISYAAVWLPRRSIVEFEVFDCFSYQAPPVDFLHRIFLFLLAESY